MSRPRLLLVNLPRFRRARGVHAASASKSRGASECSNGFPAFASRSGVNAARRRVVEPACAIQQVPKNSRFQSRRHDVSLYAVKTIPSGLLEEAVERLKAEFQPEQIFLFGSHAWGTPDEDSDVDLMVIVSESRERSIQRMQRAHRCLGGIGFAKDVLVPTRAQVDRYKHLRASLFHQVLAKGRKLYG